MPFKYSTAIVFTYINTILEDFNSVIKNPTCKGKAH